MSHSANQFLITHLFTFHQLESGEQFSKNLRDYIKQARSYLLIESVRVINAAI